MLARSILALTLVASGTVGAQARGALTIRVRVTDSTGAPMENAAVSVVRGLNEVLANGPTDRGGVRILQVTVRPQEFQVSARRVGFQPATKVFGEVMLRDSINVDLVLRRITQRLDTVRVTAEQSVKRARTAIDADAIAASTRPLVDAIDVIQKLRPNMTLEPPDIVGNCRVLSNVWVNGKRYWFPKDLPQFAGSGRAGSVAATMANAGAPTARPGKAFAGTTLQALALLNSIKPEHIESMEYHDCMDKSLDRNGGESALFITLKEGVAFSYKSGSYTMADDKAASLLASVQQAPPPVVLDAYRKRLLGIYDAVTGSVIAGADVLDVATGVHARTTETGTVSLAFLAPGASKVVLSRSGYRTDTLSVTISPADTIPITVLLHPVTP